MGLVGVANEAHANDFTDFQAAREPYERGNYADAVLAFEALVGGAVPRLTDRNIIQESRKYLGAAYLLVDPPRRADAEQQFERIVRADENQRMQAATFGESIVAIFEEVRERVRTDIQSHAEQEAERERLAREAEIERLQQDNERIGRILDLAKNPETREENSRWIATIPFGVGQFQNENTGLGVFFLTTEAVTGLGALVTYIYWATLYDRAPTPISDTDTPAFIAQEEALRISNQILFGLFAASLIAGIIEAHINFVPERVVQQERELPEDLLPSAPEPEVEVGISPFGASLTVTY